MTFRACTLCALLLSLAAGVPGAAAAQDRAEQAEQRTRTTPAIREAVYRQLSAAQEAVEEDRFQDAIATLDKLSTDDSLNSYERAQMWNIYGYVHLSRDDYRQAIDAYERLLAQDDLPQGLEENTRYSLAQLYFGIEDYAKSVTTLERWFEQTESPSANAYILLGNAYYAMGEYRRALEPVEAAFELARERGERIREHWWQLQRAIYYELGDLGRAAEILEFLVEEYPRKEYWSQLAGIYGEMDQPERQARVLDVAYQQGLLTRGSELVNLAQLLMQQDIPYRASNVLQEGLDQGVIERNERHLRLLAQAYRMAKEDEAALEPLRAAAEISGEGDLYMQLAYAYSNLKRWQDAANAARRALAAGGLSRPDQAQMFRGTALYNADELEAAKEAFRAAAGDERSARQARQWIEYVDQEIERREQLADVM